MENELHKSLTVVIVYWNTPAALQGCLDELLKNSKLQIIVINNNSHIRPQVTKSDQITYIHNKHNRGYASACNQGLMMVKTPWVLFLNPDTHIATSDLHKLLSETISRGYDASSPMSQDDKYRKPLPSVMSLLAEFTPLKYVLPLSLFQNKTLFGGGLLIKTDVLIKLGGWDERFFVWFEDSDLTKRLITNNYKVGWISIPFQHAGGESFKDLPQLQKLQLFFHSLRIYCKKHFKPFQQSVLEKAFVQRYMPYPLQDASEDGISLTIPNMKQAVLDEFLSKNAHVLEKIHEVIIVTSAVPPGEIWNYRQKYPDFIFIPIDKNTGFAPTVNIGIRRSTQNIVGTVNDDTLLNAEWFESLPKALGNKKIGSLNPVIYRPDGSIETTGITILPYGKAQTLTEIDTTHELSQSDATNAACVAYSRNALQKTGLFDEKFGSYLEDIDLSLRLIRAGYVNIVMQKFGIVHTGHATSHTMSTYKVKKDFINWMRVILKNWSLQDMLRYAPQILIERLRNVSGILKTMKKS